MTSRELATCPVCQHEMTILEDGTFGRHYSSQIFEGERPCPGTGRPAPSQIDMVLSIVERAGACSACRIFVPLTQWGRVSTHYELVHGRVERCVGSGAEPIDHQLRAEDIRRDALRPTDEAPPA